MRAGRSFHNLSIGKDTLEEPMLFLTLEQGDLHVLDFFTTLPKHDDVRFDPPLFIYFESFGCFVQCILLLSEVFNNMF